MKRFVLLAAIASGALSASPFAHDEDYDSLGQRSYYMQGYH
jgi:hypothetical protein